MVRMRHSRLRNPLSTRTYYKSLSIFLGSDPSVLSLHTIVNRMDVPIFQFYSLLLSQYGDCIQIDNDIFDYAESWSETILLISLGRY